MKAQKKEIIQKPKRKKIDDSKNGDYFILCRDKTCNQPLYKNRSSSDTRYCMKCLQRGNMKEYNFNKNDLAIIGEMVSLLSKKCEPKKCGEIVIENINNNSKHTISTDWNKVSSFIKKLEKYEVESFGFKGGRK